MPLKFGSGGETNIHPFVLVAMVLVSVAILAVQRKYIIIPFLVGVFLIPLDQMLVVGPAHIQMMRIFTLIGWIRLVATKFSTGLELFSGGMNTMDKAFTLCALWSAMNFVLLWQEWGAVVNQVGAVYTVLATYFLLRFLIRDQEDVELTILTFAYLAVPIAVIMMIEQVSGTNPYVLLGGPRTPVREMLMVRGNSFRAMASFQHPILAGVFGAIVFPLFVGLWRQRGDNRGSLMVGMLASTVIVMASLSSTPLLAYLAAIGALCLWPLRRQMRLIRWGIAICLVSLHMIMNAPVWALIARLSVVGGSDSWHRYFLVDQFIRRFDEWYLLGSKNYESWGFAAGDLTNQFIAVGVIKGLIPLIFFVTVIVCGFKYLERARLAVEGNNIDEFWIWAVSAALFSNVVAFWGVSYFDQVAVAWYALLAMIPIVASHRKVTADQASWPSLVR